MSLLAWGTDVHLDHCSESVIEEFCKEVTKTQAQALCLTGDISESQLIVEHLKTVAKLTQIPLYFILGNHDYYHGSIKDVRSKMKELTFSEPLIHWMPVSNVIALSEQACVIGHDGWSDAQHGNYETSTIRLKDYRLIEELADAGKNGLEAKLQSLGREAANELEPVLLEALSQYKDIFLLTHAPPFREACLYGTEIADDNWAPHFTCKALGDLLEHELPRFPESKLTVLAGHTHNICDIDILPNLNIKVGSAEYGKPEVQSLLSFE